MRLAGTRLRDHPSRRGLTVDTRTGPAWTGEIRFNEQWLDQPLRWKRPRRIFVCAHSDLFAEGVTDVMIDRVFAVMSRCPQHLFQVLTKRPSRMAEYLEDPSIWPLPHAWLGTSIEDQRRADERRTPMRRLADAEWLTWVSYEPAIGPVDWTGWQHINWMVSGGESGPKARPSHPDWHRRTRDWCADMGIPYHFKQWGAWAPGENVTATSGTIDTATWFADKWIFSCENLARDDTHIEEQPDVYRIGKKAAGRLLDGRLHDGIPSDGWLQLRSEFDERTRG